MLSPAPKFVIVYREHNKLMLETLYIGPFDTWDEAHEYMSKIPALGIHVPEGVTPNSGVKHVEPMFLTFLDATNNRDLRAEDGDFMNS
jgi:hypothetical protein